LPPVLAVSWYRLVGEEGPLRGRRVLPGCVPRRLWKFGAMPVDRFLSIGRGERVSIRTVADYFACGSSVSMVSGQIRNRPAGSNSPCFRCSSMLSCSKPPLLTLQRYHRSVNRVEAGPGTFRNGEDTFLKNGKRMRATTATTAAKARTSECILTT